MMLAILAEKKKKKKLNERCVLCSAQKYQRSNLSLRMVIGIPGLVKFLLVESGFREFFLTNPKSWALESRIILAQSIGIWKYYPSSKDKKSGINPVPEIHNEQHEIQNPRLSWITLQ